MDGPQAVAGGARRHIGHNNQNKSTSGRDVALVKMQIAAQARNRRWHEFLCEKHNELQACLRRQGYSQGLPGESEPVGRPGPGPDVPNGDAFQRAEPPPGSGRLGTTSAPEVENNEQGNVRADI